MANPFQYLNFPQASNTPTQPTSCAMWNPFQTDAIGKYWSFKTTEIQLETGVPAPIGTGSGSIVSSRSNSSDTSDPATPTTTISAAASTTSTSLTDASRNSEVKLPKNAVELIAGAIAACTTTTPTLTQIASQIQSQVSTYRDQELGILIRMVQHHLHRNNPAYFLPVMSPAGHIYHNPNMARWAINHQMVMVGEDGSLIRRRHRSHSHRHHGSASSVGSAHRPTSLVVTPPDATSGTYYSQFMSYPSTTGYADAASAFNPTAFLPHGTTMAAGTTMDAFGTATPTGSPSVQAAAIGAGLYDVSLSTGGVGRIPPSGSQPSVDYQFSLY